MSGARVAAVPKHPYSWHPASLLMIWALFALWLQFAPLSILLFCCFCSLLLAVRFAAERNRMLMRRTRWLLLTLAVLLLFFTPGEYLPGLAGDLGVSREGLLTAAEQLGRLLTMLASLALLHERLGADGLLAGMYCLLRPFPGRDRTVLRLMLVLEYVERNEKIAWREWLNAADAAQEDEAAQTVLLPAPALGGRDKLLLAVLVGGAAALLLWP